MPDDPGSLDPGRVGDVIMNSPLIRANEAAAMMAEVEPVPLAEAPRVLAKYNRRRKDGKCGRFVKKPGRVRKGELKASTKSRVKTEMKWNFVRAIGLVGLPRDAVLLLASYRDKIEAEVRKLYAGTPAGLYAWRNGVSAVRHEMRAQMCERILMEHSAGERDLTLEQQLLVMKHLCDASDNGDEALKRVGLDRLCAAEQEIDPWTIPLEGEASESQQSGMAFSGDDPGPTGSGETGHAEPQNGSDDSPSG